MKEEKKKYETFEEMYLATYKLVYTFIRDYTEDWSIAEEVSSNVWVKIAECPEIYLEKDIPYLHNYMRVMVKNEICNQFRKEIKQNKKSEKIVATQTSPRTVEEEYIFQEDLKMLNKARGYLSVDENLLLDLKFDKEFSAKEVGKILDINEGTVRIRQHRILMKLRKKLSE